VAARRKKTRPTARGRKTARRPAKKRAPLARRKVAGKKVARKASSRAVAPPARRRPAGKARTTPRRAAVHPRASHTSLTHEQMRLEANKELVLAFYRKMIGEKDPEGARAYMGEPYRQHSPYAKDGFEGVADFARMFKRDFPNHHYEVKRVIAEGDYVVLHLHGQSGPNPHGEAVIDIFRVKDGKVVEHWDVIQPLPETSENPNTPF
jgi:predicted SnoaL-like aldol condensation-catalyzing enzyme